MNGRGLPALLARASVEVSSRSPHLDDLAAHFSPGLDVTITDLPGDELGRNVAVAAALRQAGYNPVPHVSAREVASRESFADFLARARGEADVTRILVIAGDVARAKGPFGSSQLLLESGLLEQAGVSHVSIAGHPEGYPHVDEATAMRALAARQAWGARAGVHVDIVTQFCFEAKPLLDWLAALRRHGVSAPVHIGLAGPASPATLLRFALRCGIGNSLRALRSQIGRFGRLLSDADPGDIVHGLAAAPSSQTEQIAGFHLFPFGGLHKSGVWLARMQDVEAMSAGHG